MAKQDIKNGEWRIDKYGCVWLIIQPARRKGWWVVIPDGRLPRIEEMGRTEIEEMSVMEDERDGG